MLLLLLLITEYADLIRMLKYLEVKDHDISNLVSKEFSKILYAHR